MQSQQDWSGNGIRGIYSELIEIDQEDISLLLNEKTYICTHIYNI